MAKKVLIRRMGQTMKEGTIGSWLVKDRQIVKASDPVYELEYDKATVEVEAGADGVIVLLAKEGDTLPVGATVAEIYAEGESIESSPETKSAEGAKNAATRAPEESSAGYAFSASAKRLIRQNKLDGSQIVPKNGKRVMPEDVLAFMKESEKIAETKGQADSAGKASPLAAKVAADLGIDLNQINAHGRILAEDILAYIKGKTDVTSEMPEEEIKPMSAMRKAIARNMLNSHMTSPTVTFDISVEMTALKNFRMQLKESNVSVSYTDLLIKIVAKALSEYPVLNCSVDDNKIIYKKHVNVGVAVALDNGLVVPNIPDADKKNLTEISNELKELSTLARENQLSPDRLTGGTFTITNLGMFGIESFTPIINQPEVAILGVNTMEDRVVVRNGEAVIRTMMTLSLTADHRVIDGAVAARFLQRVKNLIEKPMLVIA